MVVTAAHMTSGHLYSHGMCCLVGLSAWPGIVGYLGVKYTRHVKSGSYYSHIQVSMLMIAMTAALQRTRQGAKALEPAPKRQQQLIRRLAEALESSSSVGPSMITGAASMSRTTNTRRGRCLAPFARLFYRTAIKMTESGRSCSWEMQRLVNSLLLWGFGLRGGDDDDQPPGHADADRDILPHTRGTMRYDVGAMRQLHSMTVIAGSSSGAMVAMRTRWLDEWLVRIIYLDRPNGPGQIAVAFETGADLMLIDGSGQNNELDTSVSTVVIDEYVLWMCERAMCGLYVGTSTQSSRTFQGYYYSLCSHNRRVGWG